MPKVLGASLPVLGSAANPAPPLSTPVHPRCSCEDPSTEECGNSQGYDYCVRTKIQDIYSRVRDTARSGVAHKWHIWACRA